MTVARKWDREIGPRRSASGNADWKAVVDSHHVDDWPPPEWLVVAGENVSTGVPNARVKG